MIRPPKCVGQWSQIASDILNSFMQFLVYFWGAVTEMFLEECIMVVQYNQPQSPPPAQPHPSLSLPLSPSRSKMMCSCFCMKGQINKNSTLQESQLNRQAHRLALKGRNSQIEKEWSVLGIGSLLLLQVQSSGNLIFFCLSVIWGLITPNVK